MKPNMDFNEIEYKYPTKIDASKFLDAMNNAFHDSLNNLDDYEYVEVASDDDYYECSPGAAAEFIRYRKSKNPELTVKVKKEKANNFHRTELDLILDSVENNDQKITKWFELIGLKKNFTIYKECWIFSFKTFTVVFYNVTRKRDNLKGAFIEIEANKKHKFSSINQAKTIVSLVEKKLGEYLEDVNEHNRSKFSLWEMYRER